MKERKSRFPEEIQDPRVSEFLQAKNMAESASSSDLSAMERLAAELSPLSMLFIADSIRTGAHYDQDLDKAEQWYSRISRAGYPIHAAHGQGLVQRMRGNFEQALDAFSYGASRDFGPSLNMMAIMRLRGEGSPRDPQSAIQYWRRGIAVRHVWSRRNLAVTFLTGRYGIVKFLEGFLLLASGLYIIPYSMMSGSWSDKLRL